MASRWKLTTSSLRAVAPKLHAQAHLASFPGPRFSAFSSFNSPQISPTTINRTIAKLTGAAASQNQPFPDQILNKNMSEERIVARDGANGSGPTRTTSGRKVTSVQVPTLEFPSPNQDDNHRQRCLIVFIPGNPGFIEYYTPFLSTLRELLDEAESRKGSTKSFHLYGQNLLGFSDADHNPPFSSSAPPFTLEDQINHFSARLTELSTLRLSSGATVPFDHILFMGHSVGAYIAVEVFHRHHLLLTEPPSASTTPPLNLKTGILLFPAISHIARSPNGQILNRLRASPFFNQWAHHIGRALVTPFPRVCLEWICRTVLGQSKHASVATTNFLTSRDGIWQALHLGKDEMVRITEDRWSEDLWEHQEPREGDEADKFFFYFGTGDRWVDEGSRDEFIAARRKAGGGAGVKVVMDEGGVPHAFCIHHSEEVASKVMGWIEEATR